MIIILYNFHRVLSIRNLNIFQQLFSRVPPLKAERSHLAEIFYKSIVNVPTKKILHLQRTFDIINNIHYTIHYHTMY